MTPAQRLEATMRLSDAVRAMALAGIREQHPDAGDRELQARLAVRLYGRAMALRAFGSVPDDAT